MFGYQILDVIQYRSDIGIIAEFGFGNKVRIMFEAGPGQVEFAWYPISFVSNYKVIG